MRSAMGAASQLPEWGPTDVNQKSDYDDYCLLSSAYLLKTKLCGC